MKTKKFGLILSAAAICCGAFGFAACNEDEIPETPSQDTVTISAETIRMDMYETTTISATSANGETIVWSNDNPAAVTLEDGVLSSVAEGVAVITASTSTASAQCVVTVYNSYSAPVLTADTDNIRLGAGDSYVLSVVPRYKGVTVEGATIDVITEGTAVTVAEKSYGTYTVSAVETGNATIGFSATVYGTALYTEVSAEVIATSASISLSKAFKPAKGGFETTLTLSSETGLAETALNLAVEQNGADITPQNVTWTSSDDSIAHEENGVIKAERAGTVKISAQICGLTVDVKVNVERETVALSDKFTAERRNGTGTTTLSLESALVGEPIKAYFANEENIFSAYAAGELTLERSGMPKFAAEMGASVPFTLETDKVIYTLNVSLYTRCISTVADLNSFVADSLNTYATNANKYGGYYVLANDIDYGGSNYDYGRKDGNTVYSFAGVFDGQGYNIDDLSVSYPGIFGGISAGAVIKNVSFTNAKNSSLKVSAFLAQSVSYGEDFTIENIYVHFKTFYHSATATNTDVAEGHRNYRNSGYTGVIFTGEQWNSAAKINKGKVKNVFVTADNYVANAGSGTILGNAQSGYSNYTNIYGYGFGGRISHWDSTDVTACGGAYADKEAMLAANIDFSSYTQGNDFWAIDTEGLPYPARMGLKSKKITETKVITGITGTGSSATVSGTAQSFTLDVSDLQSKITGNLTSITVGGTTYTDGLSYANGTITVNKALALTTYGYTDYVAIFTDGEEELKVSGQTLFVTYEITTKAELDAMFYVTNGAIDGDNTYGGYIVLGANIAYNASFGNGMDGKYFCGTFDGRGYNIDGITVGWASLFGYVGQKAEIRNMSFTNAVNDAGNTGSFLTKGIQTDSNGAWNNAFVIENIYIHFATFTECSATPGSDDRGGFNGIIIAGESWSLAGIIDGIMKNIIVTVDNYVEKNGRSAVVGNYVTYKNPCTNVYAYGFGADTRMISRSATRTGATYGVYETKTALTAAVTDFSAFTGDFWTTDSDGVPVAKSAKTVLNG